MSSLNLQQAATGNAVPLVQVPQKLMQQNTNVFSAPPAGHLQKEGLAGDSSQPPCQLLSAKECLQLSHGTSGSAKSHLPAKGSELFSEMHQGDLHLDLVRNGTAWL